MTGAGSRSGLAAIHDEPPPRLIVDPPLEDLLSQGRVYIPYRAENLRIMPVFGQEAVHVSPRLGHVHVTVDDAPWHFVDISGDTIVLVGLPPGEHRVLVELADPAHRVVDRGLVVFDVPPRAAANPR
ncbi:MAG TPA: DUF6130 family protein [Allosphingosinicella sp.]|jgi:hypothetical protein